MIVVNAAVSHVSFAWLVATQHYKDRMLENGLWAVGALAVGVGVLPDDRRHRGADPAARGGRGRRELRAVVATTGSLIVGFGWYTAVKAAYISTTFSTLVVERNLIYVAPLFFVGTAHVLRAATHTVVGGRRRSRVDTRRDPARVPVPDGVRVYSDAPGLSLLQAANRTYDWTPDHARNVMIGFVVLSLTVIVLPRVLPWGTRQVLALVAVLLLVWGVAGQMSAASASNTFSEEISADIEQPFDWIDRATGGAPTLYLGQRLTDYNGIWQMEFWNRSLEHIWSTDGSAPGPGPTLSPDLVDAATGEITQPPTAVEYVVVDPGIDIVGTPVESHVHFAAGTKTFWRLVKIVPPLRLQNSRAVSLRTAGRPTRPTTRSSARRGTGPGSRSCGSIASAGAARTCPRAAPAS